MFNVAIKVAAVEALNAAMQAYAADMQDQSVFDLVTRNQGEPGTFATISYPEETLHWPACLVTFRPGDQVSWVGLNPDIHSPLTDGAGNVMVDANNNPVGYNQLRLNGFEGFLDFQILALKSEERDRLWDMLYNVILYDGLTSASNAFYAAFDNNDLVGITVQKSRAINLGDNISMGTPWAEDVITYEATARVACVGQYFINLSATPPIIQPLSEIVINGTNANDGSYRTINVK